MAGLPCAEIGVCGSLSLSEWFTRSLLRSFLHKPQHSKHTRLHKSQNAETRSVLNTKTCFGTNSETNIYLHDVMMPMCYVKRRDSTSHINVAGAELPSHAASSSSSTVMPRACTSSLVVGGSSWSRSCRSSRTSGEQSSKPRRSSLAHAPRGCRGSRPPLLSGASTPSRGVRCSDVVVNRVPGR